MKISLEKIKKTNLFLSSYKEAEMLYGYSKNDYARELRTRMEEVHKKVEFWHLQMDLLHAFNWMYGGRETHYYWQAIYRLSKCLQLPEIIRDGGI